MSPLPHSPLRSEVVFGYLLQLVSLVLLLGQHFLLPVGMGLSQYGQFVFVVGSASLLFSTYDYGYNLLGIRKPRFGLYYLRSKLVLLGAVSSVYAAAAFLLPALETQRTLIAPILLQAFLYVLYTYLVNAELAAGRAKRVMVFSLCNGALLLGIPVGFHVTGIPISYAPALATVISLSIACALRGKDLSYPTSMATMWRRRFRWSHFRRSVVKQGQLSFATIVDAGIIWSGVVIAASTSGFEAGAIYRLVMSAVALLTQVIPLPKQALLRVARSTSSQLWAQRYTLMLILVGVLQVIAVYFVGRQGIARIFPESVEVLYHGVIILSPVAALKTILEIETIVYDRQNMLAKLIWNSLGATPPALVVGLLLDVFWGILVFYFAMVLLSATAFRSGLNNAKQW